jgi:predicted metalloprotease with PDZ domain
VHVDAEVDGLEPNVRIDDWQQGWIDPFESPTPTSNGTTLSYDYDVAVTQTALRFVDRPALASTWFAAFGKRLFALPSFRGDVASIHVAVDVPDDWSASTSRGSGADGLTFATLADLHESIFCLGDYRSTTFDVGTGADAIRVVVNVRGPAPVDDRVLFDGIQRIVAGQSAYFARAPSLPIQAFALHFYGEDAPNIPGFNAGAPTHSTIVGFHTQSMDARNPELFGMLAHENLHSWIPLALRNELGAWFNEGLNDYVAYRALFDGGVHDMDQHVAFLDKWTREYRWLAQHDPESGAIPYRRGMLAGWVFDIELRRATNGDRGLRDVLITLLDRARAGERVSRSDFLDALRAVGGRDFSALYRELVEADAAIEIERHLEGSDFRLVEDGTRIAVRSGAMPTR